MRALVFESNATSRALILEICRGQGMECEPVLEIAHLSRMTGQTETLDLLIVADSPNRQDLPALLDLFRRVLGAEVPHLLLTYGARRADQGKACPNCLNKPFLAEQLIDQVRYALGEERLESEWPEATEAPSGQAQKNGLRVLVAEDNAIAGKVITALLERQGCEVVLVRDGEEALARIRGETFAMALVDVGMPKLDGIELTRSYRSGEKPGGHLPIIALTAHAAKEVRDRCISAGMDGFLGKPVNPQDLSAMVGRYLNPQKED